MKKLTILMMMFFLLGLNVVFSTIDGTENYRLFYFNMTDNCKDEWSTKDFTASGVDFTGLGADFERADSDVCYYTSDGTIISNLTSYTVYVKFRPESFTSGSVWDEKGVSYGTKLSINASGDEKFEQGFWNNPPDAYFQTTTSLVAGTNYSYVSIYNANSDTGEILLNNVNETAIATISHNNDDTHIQIGANKEGAGAFNGFYDGVIWEMCAWNTTLTQTQLNELYAYGCEGIPPSTYNVTGLWGFEFRNEEDLSLITNLTIFIDFLSDSYTLSVNTSSAPVFFNSTLYVNLSTPETYLLRYSATGYKERVSTYTISENNFNTTTLYMLPNSQNLTVYVLDDVRQPIQNAEIKVYRYSVSENAYINVNTVTTDYEGKSIIDVQKNVEFYRFYIYYNNDLKLSTTPAYITSSELVFTISTGDIIMENFFKTQNDYNYNCDYNLYTRAFKFYYDTNNEASKGYLKVYKVTPTDTTLYNSSCVSSSTSTILLTAANTSGTNYIANGIITVDGVDYSICSNSHNFINTVFNKTWGNFFIIILIILFAFIGFFSMPMAFILTPIPLLFGSGLGLIGVPLAASIGMEVLGIALAIVVQRRG